jgi:hypothetical protein
MRSSVVLVYLLCSGAGNVISSYFPMLKKLSIMFWRWRCNFWRCILEHPAEEHFRPLHSRSNLAPPVEEISPPRSFLLYSKVATPFAAPKYAATIGDALRSQEDRTHQMHPYPFG